MSFLRYISPLRAFRDLRFFLARRRPHELWFGILALLLTFVVIAAFIHDSHVETPYEPPNIIYAESWPITRTDAEIKQQQVIDEAKRHIEEEKLDKLRKQKQAEFKKVDDWLTQHGF